jgi:uncharacterized protein (DUF58 family)
MDNIELLKKVHLLEIKTKALSKHLFSGEYHSTFKGRGMSFSEVRSYQYGDDVRNMDWNVTARMGEPHLKVFEEERELTLLLAIDVSASSFFGSETVEKQTFMSEIAAILAFSALQNNDKVGLLLFSDTIEKYIPPKKGKSHILFILRSLLAFSPKNTKTDLSVGLEFMSQVLKKRSICFVLSDFFGQSYEKSTRILARKHELIGLQITDHLEESLPSVGLLQVQDAETGEQLWIDTAAVKVQKAYQNTFEQYQLEFKTIFQKTGADAITLKTSDDYIKTLIAFFKQVGV